MILKKRIPEDFYKLFRTKNREAYIQFLIAVYEENSESYVSLGLTIEECRAIVGETISKARIIWEEEDDEEERGDDEQELLFAGASPFRILNRLIRWGWLKSDFDEKLNSYVISFPEYSQLFVELFQKLQSEDDSRERESILSVYSALFTFHSDQEKNNDILKNALHTSKSLGQLLSNMQDGMRGYFDELSGKKNFIGIQEVLVEEINNSDSRKYAILTTTDSFYRYKEAVKELISQILNDNELRKEDLLFEQAQLAEDSAAGKKNAYGIAFCEETSRLVYQVEREFDLIERKYNKLIEQKSVFAQRALARIHYILQEGTNEEDTLIRLINLLDRSEKKEAVFEELSEKMKVTAQFRMVSDQSFYKRRDRAKTEFAPAALEKEPEHAVQEMTDFVPKPLYTKKQLQSFKRKNMQQGRFVTTQNTVHSAEDLEKLLFLWQEATESRLCEDRVTLGGELKNEAGFTFSQLMMEADAREKE